MRKSFITLGPACALGQQKSSIEGLLLKEII